VTIQTTTGSRIEQARNQLGLSLPQLARRIAVKSKTLENWENDRSEPRADKLMKLAGLLQVPLIWLLTGNTPQGSERMPVALETVGIAQKLERAVAMQQELAALLISVSADVARLQREISEDQELAA
jgi:transcriptional regulator with XRE-family HTH domain